MTYILLLLYCIKLRGSTLALSKQRDRTADVYQSWKKKKKNKSSLSSTSLHYKFLEIYFTIKIHKLTNTNIIIDKINLLLKTVLFSLSGIVKIQYDSNF